MPQYNLIQRPDLSDKLARSMKINERNPAPTLAPDVQAVVLVEDLTTQSPYVRSLTRESGATALVAAVAAQFSGFQLKNATGSNVVAVVRRLFLSNAAGIEIAWGFLEPTFGSDRASTTSRYWKDQRLLGIPTLVPRYGAKAAEQVQELGRARVSSSAALIIDDLGIVVEPGRSFDCEAKTVNTAITVALEWTEYTGNE